MTPDIHALEGRGFTALDDKKRHRLLGDAISSDAVS